MNEEQIRELLKIYSVDEIKAVIKDLSKKECPMKGRMCQCSDKVECIHS
jgi:hypothetical protein